MADNLLAQALRGAEPVGGQMSRRAPMNNEPWTLARALRSANLGTMGVPVVNDVLGAADDIYTYATDPSSRTWTNYGLSAAGLLPFVPAMGVMRGIGSNDSSVSKLKDDAQSMSVPFSESETALGRTFTSDQGATISVMEDSPYSPRQNSITEMYVPEEMRGQGLGSQSLDYIMQRYDPETLSAAASSDKSVTMLYNRGFRPIDNPDATLEDSLAAKNNISSVTMVIPDSMPSDDEIDEILNQGLDMSQEARMQRARDMGFDYDVYHGSTQDISSFDPLYANPESDMGAGFYTTTSPYDASGNYAGLQSQDLTGKIERRAEQIQDSYDSYETAYEAAKAEIYGGADNVIQLKGKSKNPVVFGGDNPTYLELNQPEINADDYLDDAREYFDPDDYDDITDYEADVRYQAEELAQDASYEYEPEGPLADFVSALRDNAESYGVDAEESIAQIMDMAVDGGVGSDDIYRIIESDYNLIDAIDDEGRIVNKEIMRKSFEDAGFDAIIDNNPYHKWGLGSGRVNYMQGIDPYTQHMIFFQPNQLRSVNAAFDPSQSSSGNLLAGFGALAVPGMLTAQMLRNPAQEEEQM